MESPNSKRRRLNRERQKKFRARFSPDEIRLFYRTSKAVQRSRETTEQRRERQVLDAVFHRLQRMQENDILAQNRRQYDKEIHACCRLQELPAHKRRRLMVDAQVHALRRNFETEEQTQTRRLRQAAYRNATLDQRRESVLGQVNSLNEHEVNQHDCGPMNSICQFCGSKNFAKERPADKKFNSCCHKGKVKLPKTVGIHGNILQYPAFLKSLLTDPTNPHHKDFRKHIRSYNSAVSFASMGAQIVDAPGNGPYAFRIHGTIHHRTTHINPPLGETRKFAQLYVIDSTQASEQRIMARENEGCCLEVITAIDRFFRDNNRLDASYQMLREIEERERLQAIANRQLIPVVNMVIRRDRQSDQRRYNLPNSNEIAMVFVNEDGEPPFARDIRIYPRNPSNKAQQFININILSPNLDPMTYAILYPYGEAGWQTKLAM